MGLAYHMTSCVCVCVCWYRINPLSLVEIVLVVATEIVDMEKAIQFISSIQEKVSKCLKKLVAILFLPSLSPFLFRSRIILKHV